MDKQSIWDENNYSTEYPHVPIWMRGDANHRGASEFDRKHKKWQDPYGPRRGCAKQHKMWTDKERKYIRENFLDNRNMKILQLAAHFGVTKNSLYNQIQYIRDQHLFKKTLLLEEVKWER